MIYFDNAATTLPSSSALCDAEKFNKEFYFNPSALYRGGLKNAAEIKAAREYILRSVGASLTDYELMFTSCGSESDNCAVFGAVKRGVFVTSKGEHAAIFRSFNELKNRNIKTEFIDLNTDGTIDEQKLFDYVSENKTDFVSIVHVNNETGGINDINAISERLKKINPALIFHSDGVQAYGKIPYRLGKSVDLYSISAHKINGLKGVGALIKRRKTNLSPLIFGGGQENGLRSGTENIFGIKVFEYAAREKFENLDKTFDKVNKINKYIREHIDKNLFYIISSESASPFILTVSAKGLKGEILMHALEERDIVVGNGSACSSKKRFSRVIEACGYKAEILDGVIRLSFTGANTMDEAEIFVKIFNDECLKLKRIIR